MNPQTSLTFRFAGSRACAINRRWLDALMSTANSASGTDTTLVAGSGTPVSVGMFTGNVGVALSASSAPGNALLVAGTYNGSVEVTLSPVFTPPA